MASSDFWIFIMNGAILAYCRNVFTSHGTLSKNSKATSIVKSRVAFNLIFFMVTISPIYLEFKKFINELAFWTISWFILLSLNMVCKTNNNEIEASL
ncbi:hypothetical protein RB153_19525 [Paenibacillus larvae]|uniref:hypothetical protein n=2 Tax=Paenibacillus larvae TaxID=1464 RepID=UPI00118224DB|nr:hypothetical protein [Paenibacillus larvae]MDR5568169.1 hypothetical protein [Paenibacillus larvae]MDR5597561.1 hypothetical protein [Paenibacillus larvae]